MAIRFGLIPTGSPAAVAGFAAALSSSVGIAVEIHTSTDYRGIVAALENGLAEMAWLPPLSAARAIASGTLLPLVLARRNGTTSYSTCLFASRSGRYESLAQLRDARAAWVDRESASGYVVIRAALKAQGVSLVSAFSEESFERSHAAVARAVAEGRADVGATFFSSETGSGDIARAGWREGGLDDADVRILAQAGPIPSDIFVAHRSVSPALVSQLQAAFVDARPRAVHEAAKTLVHADAFLRPTSEHLSLLRGLLAGIEAEASPRRRA